MTTVIELLWFYPTGDEVVVDWDGYTIVLCWRPFEARNKVHLSHCRHLATPLLMSCTASTSSTRGQLIFCWLCLLFAAAQRRKLHGRRQGLLQISGSEITKLFLHSEEAVATMKVRTRPGC